MITDEIRAELFRIRDLGYRDFHSKLVPTVGKERIIGVRTPALRAYARQLAGREDVEDFLRELPHMYFDENQLHVFLLSGMKDFDRCMKEVEDFLPYVDNWATCDQLSPGVFRRHRKELIRYIQSWLVSDHTYTVRFGIGMLMQHFLDEDFDPAYPDMVVQVRSEEYYIRMMTAWYFATALAKQYDCAIAYLEEKRLDDWTHNKTIQKALESYRIDRDKKEYLRGLRLGRRRKTGE